MKTNKKSKKSFVATFNYCLLLLVTVLILLYSELIKTFSIVFFLLLILVLMYVLYFRYITFFHLLHKMTNLIYFIR
jgi:hypothetical protein